MNQNPNGIILLRGSAKGSKPYLQADNFSRQVELLEANEKGTLNG